MENMGTITDGDYTLSWVRSGRDGEIYGTAFKRGEGRLASGFWRTTDPVKAMEYIKAAY